MECEKCVGTAVFENPSLCKGHFTEYFEGKIRKTIKEFGLLTKKNRVCVAASGGKDSIVLLYTLNKFGYNVEALAVDEGIHRYRDHTLSFLKKFCEEKNILLKIVSYEQETGKRLDAIIKKGRPACNTCGTLRRHLLDKHSKGYDRIATGHNLDDESQAVLMNLFKAQKKLFSRQGPITREIKGFTRKVKPLYFLKEKEVMVYAYMNGLNVSFTECPFARLSFRSRVRDALNEYEKAHPGAKENILRKYLSLRSPESMELKSCITCGSPSSGAECRACRIKKAVIISA